MKNNNLNQYPNTRMRRLRKTRAIRELVEETSLNVNDLIYPVFITDKNNSENIELMPDIKRLCMNDLMQTAEKLVLHGIHAIALFPVIDKKYKSSNGEEAYKSDGLIQKTIAKLKSEFPLSIQSNGLTISDTIAASFSGLSRQAAGALRSSSIRNVPSWPSSRACQSVATRLPSSNIPFLDREEAA